MSERVKRTYNLSEATVVRVRELAVDYGAAKSQDAVVELAVERLYAQVREQAEAEQWVQAGSDPGFRAEMSAVAAELDKGAAWPK